MAAGGGGGEVLTHRELAMEEMDPQPGVFPEAEILRMEIASLVNLLREKQSDVLSLDPETVRKITSLRSEIACQKLARERKALVPEVKRTVPRRRKKLSAVRRVGQKKEIMADQESMDLPNSAPDTQSASSQVSCISEQMPERCQQKEIDSEKIKPASRFESNFEHVYLPYGGEDEGGRINGQFSCILEQAEALCNEMASMASILGKINTPLISYYDVSNLFRMTYRFLKISRSIYDYTCNADKQIADQYAEDQRTKEYVEMTDQVDKGKSSTHCLNQRSKEEVDESVTGGLPVDLCKSNMETHQMADDKDEHLVAADLMSGLSNQMTVHCYENQSTAEYMEMIGLTVDKGQSSTETPALRMMDQGKSTSEGQSSTEMQGESSNEGKSSTEMHASRMMDQGKSSSEGESSTETRALRMMDQGKSSSEGQSSPEMQGESSNEGKSSTETRALRMMDQGKKSSFRMVLDCDENGMPNLCKYYEMLECENAKEEDEEMTEEGVRMHNKFRKELLEMEAGLRKDREQDQKDALRWEQDQIDTPSCYTMDPIPFSLQDEAEEIEEAEETESTKSDTEEIEMEDKLFALERKGWESAWGDDCGDFEDRTVLSPMLFTHCTPGLIPYAARTVSTLQIYSVKIVGTDGKLKLPLHVYGIVAARDAVDYNRNILFSRRRENCQKLTPEDPFLRLTGPSRAIVAVDHVDFEVQLKVKGSSRSRDRALISHCFTYSGGYHEGLHTTFSSNCFCTVELSFERLTETVQATILSARVVEGAPWPFEYGGRIMCSSPPQEVTDSLSRQVVLVDSHRSDDGGEMPMGSDGYLDLSRHVVSVELEESLQFVIQAYSQSGDAIARQGSVKFRTKYCNVSQATCEIGDSKVEITVAWSQILKNKRDILLEGHV